MKDPGSLLIRWLLLAAAVWVAAEVVPGIRYAGWESILVVAALLGLFNLYLKPVLTLISLPLTIITLGLFLIVINAALLGLAAWLSDLFGVDFTIDGVGSALLGAVIVTLMGLLLNHFVKPDRLSGRWSGRSNRRLSR